MLFCFKDLFKEIDTYHAYDKSNDLVTLKSL